MENNDDLIDGSNTSSIEQLQIKYHMPDWEDRNTIGMSKDQNGSEDVLDGLFDAVCYSFGWTESSHINEKAESECVVNFKTRSVVKIDPQVNIGGNNEEMPSCIGNPVNFEHNNTSLSLDARHSSSVVTTDLNHLSLKSRSSMQSTINASKKAASLIISNQSQQDTSENTLKKLESFRLKNQKLIKEKEYHEKTIEDLAKGNDDIDTNHPKSAMHLLKKVQKLSLELQNSKIEFQEFKQHQGIELESKISEIQVLKQKLVDAELAVNDQMIAYNANRKQEWRQLEWKQSSLKEKREDLRTLLKEKRATRETMIDRIQQLIKETDAPFCLNQESYTNISRPLDQSRNTFISEAPKTNARNRRSSSECSIYESMRSNDSINLDRSSEPSEIMEYVQDYQKQERKDARVKQRTMLLDSNMADLPKLPTMEEIEPLMNQKNEAIQAQGGDPKNISRKDYSHATANPQIIKSVNEVQYLKEAQKSPVLDKKQLSKNSLPFNETVSEQEFLKTVYTTQSSDHDAPSQSTKKEELQIDTESSGAKNLRIMLKESLTYVLETDANQKITDSNSIQEKDYSPADDRTPKNNQDYALNSSINSKPVKVAFSEIQEVDLGQNVLTGIVTAQSSKRDEDEYAATSPSKRGSPLNSDKFTSKQEIQEKSLLENPAQHNEIVIKNSHKSKPASLSTLVNNNTVNEKLQEPAISPGKGPIINTATDTSGVLRDDLFDDLEVEYVIALEDFAEKKESATGPSVFFEFDFHKKSTKDNSISSKPEDSSKWVNQVFIAVDQALETKEEELILDKLKNKPSVSSSYFEHKKYVRLSPETQKPPKHSVRGAQTEYVTIRGKKYLKNATFYGLLKHLLDPENTDLGLMYAFLLHHKILTSTSDLLDVILGLLTHKSKSAKSSELQIFQIVNILNFWIDNFPTDIQSDQDVLRRLSDFIYCNQLSTRKTHMIFSTLIHRLEQKLLVGPIKKQNPFLESVPKAINPHPTYKDSKPQLFRIVEFDAAELARQICLLDFEFFQNTSPREFLFSKNPIIKQWGDHLKCWIISEILNVKDSKLRASTIDHIIDTTKELMRQNDYSGVKSIVDALNCQSIRRLTETFRKISKENRAFIKGLQQFLGDEEILNEKISLSPPPLIPWLGNIDKISCTNLFSGNNESTWIDIESMVKISSVIQNIHKWQAIKYNFRPIKIIQDHIINHPLPSDELSSEILSFLIQK